MFSQELDGFANNLKQAIRFRDNEAAESLILNRPANVPEVSFSEQRNIHVSGQPNGFAFAFDIDGVLIHSKSPLPGAAETLSHLQKHNIPLIFLTNSGGFSEQTRIDQLEKDFQVFLDTNQFVQSHTPFLNLVDTFAGKTVLVVGGVGNNCRDVALEYGFTNVITSADILKANPRFWPFNQLNPDLYNSLAKGLPQPINPENPTESLKVSAIFVFNSPRDWGLDCQLILDLLLSDNGVLGTTSPLNGNPSLPNHGYQQQPETPQLFFANPDFVWKTDYEYGPRFGQGAFITAFEAIFREATNHTAFLQRTLVGKPCRPSYIYGEDILIKKRAAMTGSEALTPLKRVTMIGDNPASDIKGAMEYQSPYGTVWDSVLVETGVYVAGTEPRFLPSAVVPNVKDAVNIVLAQEGYPLIP